MRARVLNFHTPIGQLIRQVDQIAQGTFALECEQAQRIGENARC